MAHFHLCWELGGGLGHAGRLRVIAEALLARGHAVSISLRDLAQTHTVLAGLDVPVLQAPVWLHLTQGLPPNHASLAEILLSCGYLEANALSGLANGWRAMFRQLQPDAVVADYAPTAILAARSMGLRTASVGVAFSMPPPDQPLPNMREWENIGPQRLAAAEARVLQVANQVLGQSGSAPARFAAELFLGDAPLRTIWPELDYNARAGMAPDSWHGPVFLPDAGQPPAWPPGQGPKVFAYLKGSHAEHARALQALVEEGCRVLCYLPEVAGGKAPPVSAPNLVYADQPVAMRAALAEAELCVCHAGEGTVCQALLAGVPLVLLPMQLEQFLFARQIAAAGMGLNTAMLKQPLDWRAVVRHLLTTASYRKATQTFAARHRAYSVEEAASRLAVALEHIAGHGLVP